jgi:hypothetical protein
MLKIKKFKNSNEAVVGIVAAFLIIGLIIAIISVIQTFYVPKWMEQTESEHLNQVLDQFSQLKTVIDIQSSIKKPGVPISTSITLGNQEMPFLMSTRAFGTLEILENECTIKIITNTTTSPSYSLGTIKYSSLNAYFLDQSYIYETGAVILSQDQGDIISRIPYFYVNNEEEVTISFTIVNVSTIGKKDIISGLGTYPIWTEYINSDDFSNNPSLLFKNISRITVNTKYQNSWSKFINTTLINSGLNFYGYGTDFWINVVEGMVVVNFNTSSNTFNLNLEVVTIGAQIAPGWISNIK